MRLITYGGLPSKNSPISSREAYLLAIKSRFITGIAVDLYYTNYGEIIALTSTNLKTLSLTEEELLNKTPEEIRRMNIGNMVKGHYILTLDDILEIYTNTKTSDILVLNLQESSNNSRFVDQVLSKVREYSWVDIYIKSSSNEIFSYLNTSRDVANFKLGYIIDRFNKVDLTKKVDFFSIIGNILSKEDVERLLKIVDTMYEQVDYIVDFNELVNTLGRDLIDKVMVVTDIVTMVYQNYGIVL